MRNIGKWLWLLSLLVLGPYLQPTVALAQEPDQIAVATMNIQASGITWQALIEHAGLQLTVSGPNNFVWQEVFGPGANPTFTLTNADKSVRADGLYSYELLAQPKLDPKMQALFDSVTEETRASVEAQLRAAGQFPEAAIQTGQFIITDGAMAPEPKTDPNNDLDGGADNPSAQVIVTDLVVQGSGCFGFDCVNGESFGFDTIRLKENNLRIHFQDTSVSASFPTNDWRIVANDTTNGGANYLGIEDSTAGRIPFRVEAGAPVHTLYVEADGDVGIKTANPVVDVHILEGNTPTVRLEQDGSDGFTAQTWDIAGNEAGFFIRDATNSSRLSFRIRPGAPQSSIDIAADGDVGIGTSSPAEDLHVYGTDGATQLLVQEVASISATRTLLKLKNHGSVQTEYEDISSGAIWNAKFDETAYDVQLKNTGTKLEVTAAGALNVYNTNSMNVMNLSDSGNLIISGALIEFSDVNGKEDFQAVDGEVVLARLAEMPITTWNYKHDAPTVRHIGPMAQDFYAAFGLGLDERHISPLDTNGISLAAIQAIYKQVQEKDEQISQLQAQNAELEARLESLETLIEALLAK